MGTPLETYLEIEQGDLLRAIARQTMDTRFARVAKRRGRTYTLALGWLLAMDPGLTPEVEYNSITGFTRVSLGDFVGGTICSPEDTFNLEIGIRIAAKRCADKVLAYVKDRLRNA